MFDPPTIVNLYLLLSRNLVVIEKNIQYGIMLDDSSKLAHTIQSVCTLSLVHKLEKKVSLCSRLSNRLGTFNFIRKFIFIGLIIFDHGMVLKTMKYFLFDLVKISFFSVKHC